MIQGLGLTDMFRDFWNRQMCESQCPQSSCIHNPDPDRARPICCQGPEDLDCPKNCPRDAEAKRVLSLLQLRNQLAVADWSY